MEKIEKFLQSIGLGKNESKIYVTLVEIGPSSVLQLSKETKIHRSNIYESLSNLVKEGLIFKTTKEKTSIFYARSPESLIDYLQQKEIELEKTLNSWHKRRKETYASKVGISKGKFALKEAIMSLLDTGGEEIYVWGIPNDAYEIPTLLA